MSFIKQAYAFLQTLLAMLDSASTAWVEFRGLAVR